MLTHPLLQGRSRGNDAVHADSGVMDGQSDCRCGFWIPDSWLAQGGGAESRITAAQSGYKYAYHSLLFQWTLLEGAKGVQLAEKGLESSRKRCWVDLPELEG